MSSKKIYYTMGEVAEMFGLNISTVRYWANCFDILKLERSANGNRLFRESDLENFELIYHLIKEKGMTIKGAKQHLAQHKSSHTEQDIKIIKKLEGVKSLLSEVLLRLKEDESKVGRVIYEEEDNI